MILSVDFNPILKRTYLLNSIKNNTVNISNDVSYGPGGDGIELAYFLNALNEVSKVTGLLGGINGVIIDNYIESNGIPCEFYNIKDDTAESINISSFQNENIVINTKGPRITRDEYENFMVLYKRLILESKIICVAGELPATVPKDILFDIVFNANIINKKCLIAVEGEGLKYIIEAKPHVVLMRKNQLEDLTNLKLDYEYEIIKAGNSIMEKDVNILVVSLGLKGSIVLTKESLYRVDVHLDQPLKTIPNLCYMLGGYALSIERGYDLETFLKVGQASGIVDASIKEIDMSDIKRIMSDIEVTKFNY